MHLGALRALEFDRIVAVVSGLAVTPTGEARLAELEPVDAAAHGRLHQVRARRGVAVEHQREDGPCGSRQNVASPSRGLDAEAYRRRGMRPAS